MATRPHPAPVKVICLGLGRTGTSSMRKAMEILGFGPSYHMEVILAAEGKDFPTWSKIGDGNGTPETFDGLFQDYGSLMDYPVAMYPAELYAAYPDAKFILTTRDPAKWEKSMRSTILHVIDVIKSKEVKNEVQGVIEAWSGTYMLGKYHGGRLYTDPQQELLDHNERVKRIIPSEKLLVFDVSEGWDRLATFLGVPKPAEPFPHVNDLAGFEETFTKPLSA